jgi:DNA-binding transcriptional LysR family regulator
MLNQIDLSRTDLNLLVLFEAVLEAGNVGRAAARLNLTPSAVSHGIGRLRRLLNDPLFLRTPRGVVPTARATELAPSIADLLAQARQVIATAAPFDPATSRRRFVVDAPDGVSALVLPPLLAAIRSRAPGIDIGLRQLLPAAGDTSPDTAWRSAFADLEARAADVAIVATGVVPARFHAALLFEEDFVVAARAGHSFAAAPTLDAFCAAQHLVVSTSGEPFGFVDAALARLGRDRRIALTVPNFHFALAVIAESDLLGAVPRRFAALHGPRFELAAFEPPLALPRFRLHAVVPRPALLDAGLAWLLATLASDPGQPGL